MVESSPVVHAPLSLGCPSMRVCSMVMPLAFRLEADPCTEQPTTARKADVHCSHALWESWVVGVPVMPLAFRLEADLTVYFRYQDGHRTRLLTSASGSAFSRCAARLQLVSARTLPPLQP